MNFNIRKQQSFVYLYFEAQVNAHLRKTTQKLINS